MLLGQNAEPSDEHLVFGQVVSGAAIARLDQVAVRPSPSDGQRPPSNSPGPVTGEPRPPEADWLDVLQERLVEPTGEDIALFAQLPDLPFAWSEFRNPFLSPDDRQWLLDERISSLKEANAVLHHELLKIGASQIEFLGAGAGLAFQLAPEAVPQLEAVRPLLQWVKIDDVPLKPLAAYTGVDVRNGIRTTSFGDNYDGDSGGSAGWGAVRIGFFEVYEGGSSGDVNWPARNHPGFKFYSNGTSRIMTQWNCKTNPCSANTLSNDGISVSHGTASMMVALGNVEYGQDPEVTSATERKRRSGVAKDALAHFYKVGVDGTTTPAMRISGHSRALDRALLDGVHILNHSIESSCSSVFGQPGACTAACDWGNTALSNTANAGILHVFGAGNGDHNGGYTGACSVHWPAGRRDGLTVGGLDTFDASSPYDTVGVWNDASNPGQSNGSARGGMTFTLYNGVTMVREFTLLDLAAPAVHILQYYRSADAYDGNPSTSAYDTSPQVGTSLSAPVVAGAAAALRDAFYDLGWGTMSGRLLQLQMLLMGDGWKFDTNSDPGYGSDRVTGLGRLHMHYPGSPSMVAPWGWGYHVVTLGGSYGNTAQFPVWDSGPESGAVTTWKLALTWAETGSYSQVADIYVDVLDTCPPGGGGPVAVLSDWSYDIRKRVTLTQSQIGGKCLEYRVTAWGMPAGQTRQVYVADYFDSGNPNDH